MFAAIVRIEPITSVFTAMLSGSDQVYSGPFRATLDNRRVSVSRTW